MLRRRKTETLSHVEEDPWAHLRPYQMAYNAICGAIGELGPMTGSTEYEWRSRLDTIRREIAVAAFPQDAHQDGCPQRENG